MVTHEAGGMIHFVTAIGLNESRSKDIKVKVN
jgi:hypothetical protein